MNTEEIGSVKKEYPSESQHWYKRNGEPAYTYKNAKGEEKNTTLREARKLNLVPSVTQIVRLAAAPSLENWKQDQTILACLTMPKIDGETEQDYIKRLKEDARSQAKKAAEKGTEIHGLIEKGFRDELTELNSYYESVRNTLLLECGVQSWSTEKSFASQLGFGGKVDLHNGVYLIDFKGTDKNLDEVKLWDEMYMQLAAYSFGLAGKLFCQRCGICYVHRDTAESKLIWAKEADLEKGWKCFLALLDFYYAKTGLVR